MKPQKIWFENNRICIINDSNEQLWQSLLWYPRLMEATEQQRQNYILSPFGIHWAQIDEDVSFESFTYPENEPHNSVAKALKSFPEINISQLAKRMKLPQSLLASYISGLKTPSDQRKKRFKILFTLLEMNFLKFQYRIKPKQLLCFKGEILID